MPFFIATHEHRHGTNVHLFESETTLDLEWFKTYLGDEFEPDRDEHIGIEESTPETIAPEGTPNPKIPAFSIGDFDVFHAYKDDEPASYWYRLTPDPCGTGGQAEDLTGAFDVRQLGHPHEPQLMDFAGDWEEQYAAYKVKFAEWVKTAISSNRRAIPAIILK